MHLRSSNKMIAELGDWEGDPEQMRKLIKEASPECRGSEVGEADEPRTPTWSRDGIICTGEPYKSVVKFTFAKGASLKDPAKALQLELEREHEARHDIHEGEKWTPTRSKRSPCRRRPQ